ncbi:MAG: preprotein translocase subunit SecE [Anaerorhabdus sp.]
MKWFSIEGISKEIKRIRWPHPKELMSNTLEVIMFIVFFALFFILCEFTVTYFLRLIGIGV